MASTPPAGPAGPGKPKQRTLPEERRAYVRLRRGVKLTVRVIGEGPEDDKARTRNLGMGGILLHTRKPLRPGTRLQVRAIIEAAGVDFTLGGRVIWTDFNAVEGRHEAGVCFVGLDPAQRRNVMALIGSHLEMMEGLERRHFVRLQHRLLVAYRPTPGVLHRRRDAFATNISLGGIAIVVRRELRKGAGLDMKIHLDDRPDHPIAAHGAVLAATPDKASAGDWLLNVRFTKLPPESRQRLAAYLSKMLTAPSIRSITAPLPDRPKEK